MRPPARAGFARTAAQPAAPGGWRPARPAAPGRPAPAAWVAACRWHRRLAAARRGTRDRLAAAPAADLLRAAASSLFSISGIAGGTGRQHQGSGQAAVVAVHLQAAVQCGCGAGRTQGQHRRAQRIDPQRQCGATQRLDDVPGGGDLCQPCARFAHRGGVQARWQRGCVGCRPLLQVQMKGQPVEQPRGQVFVVGAAFVQRHQPSRAGWRSDRPLRSITASPVSRTCARRAAVAPLSRSAVVGMQGHPAWLLGRRRPAGAAQPVAQRRRWPRGGQVRRTSATALVAFAARPARARRASASARHAGRRCPAPCTAWRRVPARRRARHRLQVFARRHDALAVRSSSASSTAR
jgi:hypothetical protein